MKHSWHREWINKGRLSERKQIMNKGIIIYQSKYGATKRYAGWLRQMTDYDCVETPKAVLNKVIRYDTVILCGGIYASGIGQRK